ncbi:YhgE/Pip domain-containing protein [Tumebacillus algifaecis]|nr:ABC transporter permease [Tumebacillus algifaecis]
MLAPILALIVVFIFSLVQIPAAKQTPKNVPIAIVNEDAGMNTPNNGQMNAGDMIVKMITQATNEKTDDKAPTVQWITVSNLETAQKGMLEQEYYGVLMIPSDYTVKQASLQTPTPSSPEINIYVNQGMNAMAANTVTQMLNGIVDNINKETRTKLLEAAKQKGPSLTIEQAAIFGAPITKNVHYVNQTGTLASAPTALFQPLWMGSIAGALLMWFGLRKAGPSTPKNRLTAIAKQIVTGAIAAIVVGFGLAWIADGILGYDLPDFTSTALFLTLAYFSFILMISAILTWIGIAGMPILVLLLFFGAPLLALAPEFMPTFYRDWVYSWLPMRFLIDGLREMFFFGKEFSWNQPTSTLVWIGIGSIVVSCLSILKPTTQKKTA